MKFKKTEQYAQAARTKAEQKTAWRYSRIKRIIALICALILLLTGALFASTSVYVSRMLGLIQYDGGVGDYTNLPMLPGDVDDGSVKKVIENPEPVNINHIEVRGDTDTITNVMLIGVDGREAEGYTARSDTNMILSVNEATKTIKLASLMRDVWVTVPTLDFNYDGNADYCKLNAAFYYGGFNLLSKTIEENFKLSIKRYIAVDFEAFEKAVDALGGVDVELSKEEAEFIPVESDNPNFYATPDHPELEPLGHEAGTYHLNGQQTLAYCRIRYLYEGNDFERQSNQRAVINQLIQKAKTMNFATLTGVLTAVLPYVQTNMSQQELLSYAASAIGYVSYAMEMDFSVPSAEGGYEDAWIGDGLGLWLTDPEQTTLELHQYLYNVEG